MPDQAPTPAIFSELVRTHKHEVCLFNEYHTGDRACKKVISKSTREKFYKCLSIRIIGFLKSQVSKFLLTSSPRTLNLKNKTYKTSIRKMKDPI